MTSVNDITSRLSPARLVTNSSSNSRLTCGEASSVDEFDTARIRRLTRGQRSRCMCLSVCLSRASLFNCEMSRDVTSQNASRDRISFGARSSFLERSRRVSVCWR